MKDQRGFLAQHAAVDPQFDAGIEHRDQGAEVAIARGGEERVDDLALSCEVRVRLGRASYTIRGRCLIHVCSHATVRPGTIRNRTARDPRGSVINLN